jgi:2-polyprenyl-6-methoxyphenol hydroxylase-like FAD-dependent oxidoreductase
MPGDRSPEVLIAGAGPVGLFAALSLARRGVAVRIVDTGVWACTHSYALALHPQTLPLFEELGLLDEVLEHCYPVRSVELYDAIGPRAHVALDASVPTECLAVLRQDALEGILEQALSKLDISVEWRHELSSIVPGRDSVEAAIDRYEKESRGYIVAHTEWVVAGSSTGEYSYVVGADGYNSRVRRALGLDFPEVGPAQYFAVFELSTDSDLQDEMSIVLGDGTANVLWPLPGGDCRWSFLLPEHSDPAVEGIKDVLESSGFGHFPTERTKDRVMRSEGGTQDEILSDKNLHRLIAARAPWFHAKIRAVKWRSIVRFERRMSSGFGAGRLWLAGDSAHLTGPIGVQSMNAGLAEARDLAFTLARIVRDGEPPSILLDYERRSRDIWDQLHGRKGRLSPGPAADPWVATHAAELLSCLPATGERLTAMAAQLGLEFSGG